MRLPLVCLVVLSTGASCRRSDTDGSCALTIELVDSATGAAAPGLIRLEDASGARVSAPGLLSRGEGLEANHPARRWWVLPARATLRVPRARLSIEALQGLETEASRAEIDLSGKRQAEVRIALRRFARLKQKGWFGANTHLHLQKVSRRLADRYLKEVPPADGLDALFVSYLERADVDRDYVTNGFSDADLQELSHEASLLYGSGEEHRHNFTGFGQGYGHVMFLDIRKLIRPVSIGPGIMKYGTDGIPLQAGIEQARKDGATVIWCHNTLGLEDIPNWVTGRPHAQNIFDGDPATHGSYQDTFYRYLNVGLRVPFSTGTDWFIYDFSRAYARVPELRTPRDWLKQLEAGKTFITNGPLLELEVAGKGAGETVALAQAGRIRVKARAVGRVDFRRVEVVRGGDVAASAPSRREGAVFAAEIDQDLEMAAPGWIALRIPPQPAKDAPDRNAPTSELGGPLFAHTSPVYVEVAGRKAFDSQAARSLLEDTKAARDEVLKKAAFANEHERAHVLGVYAQAVAALEGMLAR